MSPSPSYMTDCPLCGVQAWTITDQDDESIAVECTECREGQQHFKLNTGEGGTECLRCGTTTWAVAEQTDDHVMLSCDDCGTVTEVWLRTLD